MKPKLNKNTKTTQHNIYATTPKPQKKKKRKK